jgi:hypothetical protein
VKGKGSKCTICGHRERAAIDLALARGVSVTAIARRYKISTDSCYRHRSAHLPAQLRAQLVAGPDTEIDLEALKAKESQSLLANLIAVRQRLLASFDVAEECRDANMSARVANALHKNFELVARLLGDLQTGHTTINNVLVQPVYIELRTELVRALQPFPEARHAVAAVLHQVEAKAAQAVTAEAQRGLAA